MENVVEQHNLKNNPKFIEYIKNIKSINQIQQNRWNFYGIAWQSTKGFFFKIPKINVLLWPTSIKVATIFAPKKKFFKNNYLLKQKKRLIEHLKLERFHNDKKNKLFTYLWKRNNKMCFICDTSLIDEVTLFKNDIEIQHIKAFAKKGSNKSNNFILMHKSCHKN